MISANDLCQGSKLRIVISAQEKEKTKPKTKTKTKTKQALRVFAWGEMDWALLKTNMFRNTYDIS